jgi:hypothetical protein
MSDATLITDAATTTEGTEQVPTTPTAIAEVSPEAPQGTESKQDATPEADAPEVVYEFKAPEGQQYNPNVISKFAEACKELKLPVEGAQKMIDMLQPVLLKEQLDAVTAVRAEWKSQSKADPEIGGEKLAPALAVTKSVLDRFATPGLISLLEESGLGNHPEVIRMFTKFGSAISEDKVVSSGSGVQTPASRTPAQILYG